MTIQKKFCEQCAHAAVIRFPPCYEWCGNCGTITAKSGGDITEDRSITCTVWDNVNRADSLLEGRTYDVFGIYTTRPDDIPSPEPTDDREAWPPTMVHRDD